MNEDELRALLKTQGWTVGKQPIGKQQKYYAYSAKKYIRAKSGSITRYIGTTNKLAGMTEGDVLKKLTE